MWYSVTWGTLTFTEVPVLTVFVKMPACSWPPPMWIFVLMVQRPRWLNCWGLVHATAGVPLAAHCHGELHGPFSWDMIIVGINNASHTWEMP